MNKELLFFIEAIANEKALSKQDVATAVEEALASAIRKTHPQEIDVLVNLDQKTGDYDAFRIWRVVDPENMPEIDIDEQLQPLEFDELTMISLEKAQRLDSSFSLNDYVKEPIAKVDFGRIGAQTAKHVIFQKLREISRRKIAEQFEAKIGEILHTTVKRLDRDRVILDLGDNIEGQLMPSQKIASESYSVGRRVRAYLYEVSVHHRTPQIYLSRTSPAMIEELMRMEIPEIADGVIEVRAVARDPGERAKVAVFTGDPHLDPVGACVGIRGTRINAISSELMGERIDVIVWDSNPAQFVMKSLASEKITSISIDESNRTMNVGVAEEALAQVIGRNGQNVRLASELTGWNLNVMSSSEMDQKALENQGTIINELMTILEIDESIAKALAEANITSVEEIAFLPEEELLALPGFTKDGVDDLRMKANDAMLMSMLDE